MSTRCNIIFTEAEDPRKWKSADHVILYRHSDGYPDGKHGVLEFLARFVPTFLKYRPWHEVEYMAAQCLAQMIVEYRQSMRESEIRSAEWDRKYHNEKIQEIKDGKLGMDKMPYHDAKSREAYQRLRIVREADPMEITRDYDVLSHGIEKQIAGDAEYVYVVTPLGVHAFDVDCMSPTIDDTSKWKSLLNKTEAKRCRQEGYVPPRYRDKDTKAKPAA